MPQDITTSYQFGGGYIQRFNATLGLNGSPTQVEMEIIVDTDGQAGVQQSFDSDGLEPGNISGITVGAFQFRGLVQSWTENFSPNGLTYTVRLTDPRVCFNDIRVLMDGRGPGLPSATNINAGSGIYNVINVYDFYGNDIDADFNDNGMSWNKIKAGLEGSGVINLYNTVFSLQFDPLFAAPEFLRINTVDTSLDQLIQTAANSLGLDYYVDVDYNINKINIAAIKRDSNQQNQENMTQFLAARQAEGKLTSYTKGKELRVGPTDVVVLGANFNSIHSILESYTYWGKLSDGTTLTAAGNSTQLGASFEPLETANRYNGYVVLENITSDNPLVLENLPDLEIEGKILSQGSPYFTQSQSVTVKGYRPTENVMRAALYSRESWEAILVREQPDIAAQLGITTSSIKLVDDVIDILVQDSKSNKIRLANTLAQYFQRNEEEEALLELVYQITKDTADEFYGKTFMVILPFSTAFLSTGDTQRFRYGYKVVDAAWYDNASNTLQTAGSKVFRTDDGRYRSHITLSNIRDSQVAIVVIKNPDGNLLNSSEVLKYDLSNWSSEQYLLDGNDCHFVVNVDQDSTNFARVFVTLPQPLELKPYISENYRSSYIEFWRAMGATDDQISYLLKFEVYNEELGLAPQRVNYFNLFQIAIENELRKYGPFIRSAGPRPGGTTFIVDDSIAPWHFGNFTDMNQAGNDLADLNVSDRTVIDLVQFNLAGIPEYNLGHELGANANITNLNITFSQQGLNTNYSLQTFANPFLRLSKVLSDKINKTTILTNRIEKDRIKLEDRVQKLERDTFLDFHHVNLKPEKVEDYRRQRTNYNLLIGDGRTIA